MSIFLDETNLWATIKELSKKSRRVVAVVGFVGRHPDKIMKWPRGSMLIADLSENAIKTGASSARGALTLFRKGVRIFQTPSLHAKVYLFDKAAVVASANASENSQYLIEAGILLKERIALQSIRRFVHNVLSCHASVELDAQLLAERIKWEPKRKPKSFKRKTLGSIDSSSRIWLIPAYPDTDETKEEAGQKRKYEKDNLPLGKEILWYNQCGKRLYKSVRDGDLVFLFNNGTPRRPFGWLEGPWLSFGGVDIGSKFKERRYCLALTRHHTKLKANNQADFKALMAIQGDTRSVKDVAMNIRSKAVLLSPNQKRRVLIMASLPARK